MAKTATKTIPEAIKVFAEEKPDKEAFVFVDKYGGRISLSRKEVWDKSRQFAAILKRQGIGKGDVVCNTLLNSPEKVITQFGTLTAGAISMHGQLLMAHGEDLIQNLRTSKCKSVIVDAGVTKGALSFIERLSYKDETTGEIRYRDLPYLTTVFKLHVSSDEKQNSSPRWLHTLGVEKDMFAEVDIKADDIAVVFNTSGTTGFSKLVPHAHGRLRSTCASYSYLWPMKDGDVFFSNRSVGWVGGFPHVYIQYGSKFVITDYVYGIPEDKASHMVKVFEEEMCTHANFAGIEVEQILEHIDKPLPSLLKSFTVGGGPIASFIKKASNVLTKEIVVGYGGSEFCLVSAMFLDSNSSFESYCTGSLVEGVEMKILDKNLEEVPRDNVGEIFLRSQFAALHYLNNPEKTKETFLEDGWIRTGDIGYQNKKDQLFVLGRTSNAIMKGSFIFYPGWLESQILKCPGIQSAVIIGVPDPILHEEICLCVIPTASGNLTEEIIRDFCQKLFLTSVKEEITPMPKYFLFLDEFPFTLNLKLDRAALKTVACEKLNISLSK